MFVKRIYTAENDNITITTAGADTDLWYIAPADDKPVYVCGWNIDQLTDVGDAAEEMVRYKLIRGHSTVGSGGAAVTPTPLGPTDGAFGGTVRGNDTTIASAGTPVDIASYGFNIRVGERLWLPPEFWIPVSQAQASFVLRIMAAPADDINVSTTIWFAELM